MKKYIIITIDTEGDNLWKYNYGDIITTKNAHFIPRFHELCMKYGFKPVYLVNYEMVLNDFFCEYAVSELKKNNCEIGIHPHAWNSPPVSELKGTPLGPSYLIEYPLPIMRQKFDFLFSLITEKFNIKPVSHRAGRWTMNQDYFDLLMDYDIKIDCSVTPGVSWESSLGHSTGGSDYRNSNSEPFVINHSKDNKTIIETPMTIRKIRYLSLKHLIFGKYIWLRPNGNNLSKMIMLVKKVMKSKSQYLMFMLHSSELMPGGSPTFKTDVSIEKLYCDLNILFEFINRYFQGITLSDYANIKN